MKAFWILPYFLLMGYAYAKHPQGMKDMGMMEEKITKELSLSAAQKAKLHDAMTAMKDIKKDSMDENMAIKNDMKALILAPKLDKTKFKETMAKKEDLMKEKKAAFYEEVYPKLASFHDSLTAEQREKAVECMENHHEHGWMY